MASCVSPPPRYLAFLLVHTLFWRPSFLWRREQRDEEVKGEVKEWKMRGRELISHLIQSKTMSKVASNTTIVLTATVVVHDDDDDVTET
jgi:hypothetical protein